MREKIPSLFSDCLDKECILYQEEKLRPYECDAYTAYKSLPLAVLLPESRQQVINIIKQCREHHIPIVTRGAGTGLSGGAHPIESGILLNLSKINKIHEINPQKQFARVDPGVRNLAISEAAAEFGLYYAPDPSSQIAPITKLMISPPAALHTREVAIEVAIEHAGGKRAMALRVAANWATSFSSTINHFQAATLRSASPQ
ncbi:MAG: FAD-binding protein [Pseudomonadota bacterium]